VDHFEYGFLTKDNTKLYGQGWKPKKGKEIKGVVFLNHGLGDHSGRYLYLAEALTETGYILISYDMRGHGKSPGKRGYSPGYEILMDDISRFIKASNKWIRSVYPKKFSKFPHFLYGHSMGGNLILNYCLRRKKNIKRFKAVIITSPYLLLELKVSRTTMVTAKLLGKLLPKATVKKKIHPNKISRYPVQQKAYGNDPMVHGNINPRAFIDLENAAEYALKNANKFSKPLLIMHGGADEITSPEGSREFARMMKNNVTLKIWKDSLHETHNDLDREKVFEYIFEWLNERI